VERGAYSVMIGFVPEGIPHRGTPGAWGDWLCFWAWRGRNEGEFGHKVFDNKDLGLFCLF